MPFGTADHNWKRTLVNPNASSRSRIFALSQIERPSLSMLRKLILDPNTTSRLMFALSKAYSVAMTRKTLRETTKENQ